MTQNFDTLYTRNSKGKVLEWSVSVVKKFDGQVDIKVSNGEYLGAKKLSWQRNVQGVNIGKSNETTPYQQAISVAESKIERKRKQGYLTYKDVQDIADADKEETAVDKNIAFSINLSDEDKMHGILNKYLPENREDADGDIKPMKAQQYYRSKKNWIDPDGKVWDDRKYYYLLNPHVKKEKGAIITSFPCMGQPKINGVRATIRLVDNIPVIKSKEGLIYNIPHVQDFLTINNDIFDDDIVLDGELYIHGEPLQNIGSAVKKHNLNTSRIVFVLFDVAVAGYNQAERWQYMKQHIKPKLEQHINCPVQLIKATLIDSDERAQKYTDYCIEQGYEGIILREPQADYKFGGRPKTMTKLKRLISEEFIIKDVIPQKKDPTKGNFVCVTKDGQRFDVTPKGDDGYKMQVLAEKHKFIGKPLTCDFYEYTAKGLPFHIVYNVVRDYE